MKQITLFPDINSTESNKKDETKKSRIPDEKRLNHLTGKEWIKFSKSWFTLKRGVTDREKIKAHPATFPAQLAEEYIAFFHKARRACA